MAMIWKEIGGGGGKKLLPKASTWKDANNSNAYSNLTVDVSELTSISYVASTTSSTYVQVKLDGTAVTLESTTGIIDVSSASEMVVKTYSTNATERTFEITDYE